MIEEEVAERLRRHEIIWLTTVRPDGQPQTYPVWFLLDGAEIRVWSIDGVRVRNLSRHPKVSLHLSDDGRGGDIVTIEGEARIDLAAGLAGAHPAYRRRYQALMDANGWTWEYFDGIYHVPIAIRPTRVQVW